MSCIIDLVRESQNIWSFAHNGIQYVIQLEQDTGKPYISLYNDVVGGYQLVINAALIDQIISQLDFEEMLEQDWLQEQDQQETYSGDFTSEAIVQHICKFKQE